MTQTFNKVSLNPNTIEFLEKLSKKRKGCTFDEITLADRPTEFHPNEVNLTSYITRNIQLKGCGIVSSAMDTVTEKQMALAVAKMGGIGIIHRNLSPKEQAEQVRWVRYKINDGGMIENPITFLTTQRVSVLQQSIKKHSWPFTSFPIVDENGKLEGLVTKDQIEFIENTNPELKDIMIKKENIVVAKNKIETNVAYSIMKTHKVKKLPVVDDNYYLIGMFVWNDVKKDKRKQNRFSIDSDGHFLVGAAIGLGPEEINRIDLLANAGCKVLVIDSSHGACIAAKKQLELIRNKFGSSMDIIIGNVASYESTMYLLEGSTRPDGLKVGIGPGSICTTRDVTGHGIPQMTALFECWKAVNDYGNRTGYYVPLIADGGIRSSGDIVKCLAAGASSVMLGSILAGADESPSQTIVKDNKRYKRIRGMGSKSAMEERKGSRDRYHNGDEDCAGEELTQQQVQKLVPEGVEGLVEYKGDVESILNRLLGGIQAGLAHSGSMDIFSFQNTAQLWFQSFSGTIEGKPHNITNIIN